MRAGWVDGWTVVAERVVVYLEPIPLRPATPLLLPLPAGRVDAARAVCCVATPTSGWMPMLRDPSSVKSRNPLTILTLLCFGIDHSMSLRCCMTLMR